MKEPDQKDERSAHNEVRRHLRVRTKVVRGACRAKIQISISEIYDVQALLAKALAAVVAQSDQRRLGVVRALSIKATKTRGHQDQTSAVFALDLIRSQCEFLSKKSTAERTKEYLSVQGHPQYSLAYASLSVLLDQMTISVQRPVHSRIRLKRIVAIAANIAVARRLAPKSRRMFE